MALQRIILWTAALVLLGAATVGCSEQRVGDVSGDPSPQVIVRLEGARAFDKALVDAGDALVVVDFYADWCGPCRELNPVLEEIARKHADKATFYKVNVDRNRDLARAHRVSGIPHVMFIRRGEAVHSIIGVQPSDAYLRAIGRFAGP
jgi:thioredoxin 1